MFISTSASPQDSSRWKRVIVVLYPIGSAVLFLALLICTLSACSKPTVESNPSSMFKIFPAVINSSGWPYTRVRLADFDSDGDLDMFESSGKLWRNEGFAHGGTLGNFELVGSLPDGGSGLGAGPDAALGDVDGDGDIDIVLLSQAITLTVWINQNGAQYKQNVLSYVPIAAQEGNSGINQSSSFTFTLAQSLTLDTDEVCNGRPDATDSSLRTRFAARRRGPDLACTAAQGRLPGTPDASRKPIDVPGLRMVDAHAVADPADSTAGTGFGHSRRSASGVRSRLRTWPLRPLASLRSAGRSAFRGR